MIDAPALDEYLRLHELSMSSFDGMSIKASLRLAHLDGPSVRCLGAAHRERAFTVRGALLDRLAKWKAEEDKNPPADETVDPSEGDALKVIVLAGKEVATPDGAVHVAGEVLDLPDADAMSLVTFGIVRAADAPTRHDQKEKTIDIR